MDNNDPHKPDERLERAYHAMMQRVQEALSRADDGVDTLNQALRHARDTAVNLGELSREEAARVSDWVQRDMQDAGSYLARTGHELRDWLHMDLELIEYSLLDLLTSVADKTRLEMLQFEEDLSHQGEYHSGEIAGPGTLECRECGELLHFKQAGHIPPCPRCHATSFGRKSR
jgi:hypothetical protein